MNKNRTKRTFALVLAVVLVLGMFAPVFGQASLYKKGDSSSTISEMQSALKKLGYFQEDCTGYFGPATERAVIAFQKAHGLDTDGVLGPNTIALIKKYAGSSKTSTISRGQTTRTSATVSYTVKEGDTIWDIADEFNVSVSSILKANGLKEDSVLQVGDKLTIPGVYKTVTTTKSSNVNNSSSTSSKDDNICIVKEGDSLWTIAEDYGVTVQALMQANNLTESSVLQVGDELKIPEVSDTNTNDNNNNSSDTPKQDGNYSIHKGEYLGWFDTVQYIFKKGDIATVTDIDTGKSFKVRRLYGKNHADSEPLTAEDTAIMKSIYGSWSWDRRAIVVTIDGRHIAASMNGMPHGGESIGDNNFNGHFCIHFRGSKTHASSHVDARHQAAVKRAAGL